MMNKPVATRRLSAVAAIAVAATLVLAATVPADAASKSTGSLASRMARSALDQTATRPVFGQTPDTGTAAPAGTAGTAAPTGGTVAQADTAGTGVDAPAASNPAPQPAPAGSDNGRGTVLEGVLFDAHGDPDLDDPNHQDHATDEAAILETADGIYEVRGLTTAETRQLSGKKVKLRGEQRGGTLVLADGVGGVEETGGDVVMAATETRNIAVVLINFSDNTTTPFTADQARTSMFNSTTSVDRFVRESSYDLRGITGNVFGWYTIPNTSTTCAYWDWATAARAELTARGVSLSNYQHFMYVFPRVSACGWAGLATVGGSNSWINGNTSAKVMAHELGHNFTYRHAGTMRCTNSSGAGVVLSDTCTRSEYGDPFDTMGSSYRTLSGRHRQRSNWLSDTQTVSASGSYTVRSLHGSTGPRQLRISRGDGTSFFIEARRAWGTFDTFAIADGAHVRIHTDTGGTHTWMLDATPETSGFTDAAFTPGRSFTDPVSGVSIAVTAATANDATVSVSFTTPPSDTTAPSAPTNLKASSALTNTAASVSLSWAASSDNVGVAGYRISRNTTALGTTTALGYTDTNAARSTTYSYSVVAFDAAGNNSPAATVSVTTPAGASVLTAPGSLTARVDRKAQTVILNWQASGGNVVGYRVSRNGTVIAQVSTLEFVDAAHGATKTHLEYTVVAVDGSGNMSPPASVRVRV
jgi:hypothetical protein